MPAYAVPAQQRRRSPTTFTLIVGAHVLAVALLATAQMDVGTGQKQPNTRVIDVPLPPPPPEPKPEPPKAREQAAEPLPSPPDSFIDQRPPLVPLPSTGLVVDPGLPGPPAVIIGPAVVPQPGLGTGPAVSPSADPVRVAARLATPAHLLRPPYPDSKRRDEEEAVLRLRLTIDARGRVTGVMPVGAADEAFVGAARAHLTRHWRYRPATEDGREVASTLVVTLRFELEDE